MAQKQLHKKVLPGNHPVGNKKSAPVKKNIPFQKSGPKVSNEKKANRYYIIFFFILAFALYGNTCLNKWAVDDEFVTGPDNQLVHQGFKAIPKIFTTPYVNATGNIGSQSADYRPVVKLTFAIEYGLWGEKPGVSHGISVLIYFFISILLFFILKGLLKNYNVLFPFLITIVFIGHPIHSEVVASLKNRDEMLAFLCGLGGLYYFIKYADTNKNRYFFYALTVFFIGYLAKSSILPFLVIYPLTLYFFREMEMKKFIRIFGALIIVLIIAYFGPRLFLLQHVSRQHSFIENPLYFEKNFWNRTGTGLISLLFYLKKLVYPYPLLYYYGYNMIPVTGWGNIWVWVSFFLYSGLLIYALMKFREKHLLSFAILIYMVFIAMYSNIVSPVVGIVGERFVFAGSLGFCIALIYMIFTIFGTDPKRLTIEISDRVKIIALVFVLLIPSGYIVIKRNRAWRNIYDLCSKDVARLQNSSKANIQYAGALMSRVYHADPEYQKEMADHFGPVIITYFKKGLAIYPKNYEAINDLASVYIKFAGRPDTAVVLLKQAIQLDSTLRPAWVTLASAYRQMKNSDSAIYCYNRIIKQDSTQIYAISEMANVYNEMGNVEQAISLNREIIRKDSTSAIPYLNLGNYYMQRSDTVGAVHYWEKAARLKPTYELCMELNMLFRIKGDMQKANSYYEMAVGSGRNTGKRSP